MSSNPTAQTRRERQLIPHPLKNIMIVRNKIQLIRPLRIVPVFGLLAHDDEIGGNGNVRSNGTEEVSLGYIVLYESVGRVSPPVELLRWVEKGASADSSRGKDLAEVAILL